MEIVKAVRLVVVPRAGVEPARPFGQRTLIPVKVAQPNLKKRYEPVFTCLAVVKVSLRLATYQQVRPHLLKAENYRTVAFDRANF